MKRTIIVAAAALALALALSACTAPNQSREVLLDAGYSNIEVGGYDWFGCSEDDALDLASRRACRLELGSQGVVCAGMFFKGATIRNTRRG